MNVINFLKAKAYVSGFFGVCMLLFYSVLMPVYGLKLSPAGTMMTQWSGALFIGIGLICWYASQSKRTELFKGVLFALFICDSAGFLVSLSWQLKGVANFMGWTTVALWLCFAAGLGYYRFSKQAEIEHEKITT